MTALKPDGFTPTVVKQTDEYLYVEYESPTFGFVDDVEFWLPADKPGMVEYRRALFFLCPPLHSLNWPSVSPDPA